MSDLAKRLDEASAAIKSTGAKILTIDIERLPGTAYVWEPKTRYIPARNFKEWPSLLCFSARWYGDRTMIFESAWNDRERMINKAWDLYNEADIVVTYNGVRFDNKHLMSDWIEAEKTPPAPWKDLDLFQQVKKFGFESKSLDSVTRRLGRPGKPVFYDLEGALACMEGDKDAQEQMEFYNASDVELTEWLHDRMLGWMHNAPFKGTFGTDLACQQCGSQDLELQEDKTYRAVVLDYSLYLCKTCGGWNRTGWCARAAGSRGVK
jgi:hypothetical protein